MSSQANWAAMRAIAAKRDGYRCRYCRVPTAATIEHVRARSTGGGSYADNLVLACPYCNRKKGVRDLETFLQEEAWKLPHPQLPESTRAMLTSYFGIARIGVIATGSANAKLEVRPDIVSVLVRAHKRDQWRRMPLGPENSYAVCAAAWDFLTRHDTPSRPRRRPPRSVFT